MYMLVDWCPDCLFLKGTKNNKKTHMFRLDGDLVFQFEPVVSWDAERSIRMKSSQRGLHDRWFFLAFESQVVSYSY